MSIIYEKSCKIYCGSIAQPNHLVVKHFIASIPINEVVVKMSSLQKKKRTNRKDKGNWQLAKATRTHSTSKANYLFHFMSTIPVLENLLWSQAIKITTWAFVTIAYSFFKSWFSTPNFFFLYIWAPWQFLDHMTRVLINLRLNNQNRFWTGPEKKSLSC